jgi:hypothetical protein
MKILKLCAKINDQIGYDVYDADGKCVATSDNKNPFRGDYLQLEIDLETGQILNWNAMEIIQTIGEQSRKLPIQDDDFPSFAMPRSIREKSPR